MGSRIFDAAEGALNLKREATAHSRAAFSEHGNMSSPVVLFVLDRLLRCHVGSVRRSRFRSRTVEAALLRQTS